jgi:hypothetical protein
MNTGERPRVWITAFWGFDPTNEGYYGFTVEGNRRWFLDLWREGDLILIYGADAKTTAPEQRHQTLGFLEIEPREIRDVERLSEIGIQRKTENNWLTRWTFAVPVIRAAKVLRPVSVNHIAWETLTHKQARIIASRGALLTPEEAEVALSLKVAAVDVFGMPPLSEEELGGSFKPSKGIRPSFGKRESNYVDGEHRLYALRLDGDTARLLGRGAFALRGQEIYKVGYSNDPVRRCEEHNCGFPPASKMRWKAEWSSRPFASAEAAFNAETRLKADLATRGESLGGEFFLCSRDVLSSCFAASTLETADVVLKARGRR